MKKKTITVLIVLGAIVINAGFFPLINFNQQNPVEINMVMKFVTLLMAVGVHSELGLIESKIYSKWSFLSIGAYNIFLVAAGLLGRYLLEFGEISNTYNFTWYNILFQIAVLSLVSTGTYLYNIKKKPTDTEN